MANYLFSDLLTIFVRLQQNTDRKTQADLAKNIGIAPRTLSSWLNDGALPRYREDVIATARVLELTQFLTDLLLYSINPNWIEYGTPVAQLQDAKVLRYEETHAIPQDEPLQTPPRVIDLQRTWRLAFVDRFMSNHKRWGTGTKNDGTGSIERTIKDGMYVLTLQSFFHANVFMGGDSHCFAPTRYCLAVEAQLIEGDTDDEGYALIFEEISDSCHALFRIREQSQVASVVQTMDGEHHFTIHLNREPVPWIRPRQWNALAIVADHDHHWFYVNHRVVAYRRIERLSHSRLDVGVTVGEGMYVRCHFRHFRVYTP